jgi:DNA uptake protein ComE-like DNA-binding protein
MAMHADKKALVFLGIVALLGAGARVVRARGDEAPGPQPALEHQLQRADSAARAGGAARRPAGNGRGGRKSTAAGKIAKSRFRGGDSGVATDQSSYLNGRLDLDVASASQIESLPKIGKGLARRIIADRAARGPFVSVEGLRRVKGITRATVSAIDTLVTFSGTIRPR